MQIVIPMSGIGKRFIDAGYQQPKSLIEIDGLPVIEHVVRLFPGEENFIFICNEDHIARTNMEEVLTRIAPKGRIFAIPPHKLGPVYAVQQIYEHISDDDEVIINYCDFGSYWDYLDFLKHTRGRSADGAIPAYKGFHPHMLGSTNYAFMRDDKQWMLEIQEKMPFTDNRMEEYASNGTYYFKSGSILKRFFDEAVSSGDDLNGEFYVSVVYNHMVAAGLKISIFEIQHMLQWGTPQDVEEYFGWSKYFSTNQQFLAKPREVSVDYLILPMAGLGSRFAKNGYDLPKPLIEVNGQPMVSNAIRSAPGCKELIAAILKEHDDKFGLAEVMKDTFPSLQPHIVDGLTEGQASTCSLLVEDVEEGKSIFISACDNGMVWDEDRFLHEQKQKTDVLVWAFRDHPHANKNPNHYGWINVDNNDVLSVSVKQPISDDPSRDWGIVGAFYFSDVAVFRDAYKKMVASNDRVNDEFYVDTLINYVDKNRYSVKIMPVDHYICWGTPDDYNTFVYWQSYFHKSSTHLYELRSDLAVPAERKQELNDAFFQFNQKSR